MENFQRKWKTWFDSSTSWVWYVYTQKGKIMLIISDYSSVVFVNRIPSKNTHSVPTHSVLIQISTYIIEAFFSTDLTYIFLTKKICWTLPKAMKSIIIFRREGKICVSLTLARRSVITPLRQQFHHQRGLRPWTRGFDFAPRKNIYSFWYIWLFL